MIKTPEKNNNINKMRHFFPIITLIISLMWPAVALAVTEKEMEQARTIAAKAYLRYANDGSGYLDEINPTTMADLEKALKTKEKENIKAFKAIPVPSDYKNWDKQKLVEYWSVTAYQTKGLIEKGKLGKTRTKNLINKMNIAAPQKEPAPSEKKAESASTKPAETPSPATDSQANSPAATDTIASQGLPDELVAAEESALGIIDDAENEPQFKKAEDHTWVWLMILGILVAVIVTLVVFASNVIKKNERQRRREQYERQGEIEEVSDLKDAITDKDTEITMLTKKLESVNRQNSELKHKLEALTAEIAALRNSHQEVAPVVGENVSTQPRQGNQPGQLRTIYLGRANHRGIFVRADRNLNIGNSFFRLDTSDGFTGTFRVADSQEVWTIAISNPPEYLSGACVISNPQDAQDATRIVTESAGTAAFEGGCWRVIRKSKIRFA